MAIATRRFEINGDQLLNLLRPRNVLNALNDPFAGRTLPLGSRELTDFKERMQARIFRFGLDSRDQRMGQARWRARFARNGNRLTPNQQRAGRRGRRGFDAQYASTGEITANPYRFQSGQLKRSLKIKVSGRNLVISWRREQRVFQNLDQRYPVFLAPSPSDLQYLVFLMLRNAGRLPRGLNEPLPPA